MEEISFNAQDQAPDDDYTQDRQCVPLTFVDNPLKGRQVFARLLTKQETLHLFLQLVSQDSAQELFRHIISPYLGISRTEFQFCSLRIRFSSQGVVCLHSDISHFFLQLVSQDSAQELFRHTISSYLGISRIEFQFFCLRILMVPPYLFNCIYHLSRRHMMSHLLFNFISFRTHYSFLCDIFLPSDFALFIQLQINNQSTLMCRSLNFSF